MINTVNISSGTAQTLLETAGLAQFDEPVYLPDENKSMQIIIPKVNRSVSQNKTIHFVSNIKANSQI
jgi:hypothetical protein